MSYELVSAVERNAQHPSFEIPTETDRKRLHAGCLAKLIFRSLVLGGAERMWVRVTAVNDGQYVGTLTNDPLTSVGVVRGGLVNFGPEHICECEFTAADVVYSDA